MALEFNEEHIAKIAQALPNVGHDVLIRSIMYCNQVDAISDDVVKMLFNKFISLANEEIKKQSDNVLRYQIERMD
jgi:hypothetical protein